MRFPPDLGAVCAVPRLVEDVKLGSPCKRAKCLDESWGDFVGACCTLFRHAFYGWFSSCMLKSLVLSSSTVGELETHLVIRLSFLSSLLKLSLLSLA